MAEFTAQRFGQQRPFSAKTPISSFAGKRDGNREEVLFADVSWF